MGLFNNSVMMGASGAGAYEIERSLRFNSGDSAYLDQTPSSTGNRRTFTFSCWFKRSSTGSSHTIFQQRADSNSSRTFGITIRDTDDLRIIAQPGTGGSDMVYDSTQLFRDTSAWYHLVVAVDTTDSLADRQKAYINGVQITDWAQSNNYSADFDNSVNHASKRVLIGAQRPNSSSTLNNYFDGYLAEIHLIDGLRLDPTSFGKTDATTGAWIPKKYAGAYGTCGFYLDFKDNSNTTTTTLGKDSSGNSLNFTCNNFSVAAGVGCDSVIDTPTNNYATLNTIDGYSTLSYESYNGALDYSISDTSNHGLSTISIPTSGKWYAECTPNALETICFGIRETQFVSYSNAFETGILYLYYGRTWKNNSEVETVTAPTSGDIMGCAVDRDNNTVQFSLNGTNVGNTIAMTTTDEYQWWVARGGSSGNNPTGSVNFGQRAFSHQPSGFVGLCTSELPEPTIKNGTDYFNSVTYTGTITDTSTQTVSGVGFQPNLTWIKRRDSANSHQLVDSVRGGGKWLESSGNNAEQTNNTNGVLTAFNTDGFVLTGGSTNANLCCEDGNTYVSWNWKESASAGFDIVSFTPSSGTNTYSHGLGVKPDFIIFKSRESSANWDVYSSALTAEYKVYLNDDSAKIDSGFMSDTEPTSSVFSFNPGSQDGNDHIAYCFSNVKGYSKAGSYVGNGVVNGPFIHTGFKPAMVIGKDTSGTDNWWIFDNKRSPYNLVDDRIFPSLDNAEGAVAADSLDFLSNGFKLRGSGNFMNESGNTFIFLAFAETPFKYSNAR